MTAALSGQKRKVEMSNASATIDAEGKPVTAIHTATDYVPVEWLEKYVADARTRWQSVIVGDEHDSGPGGDDGETFAHEHLL